MILWSSSWLSDSNRTTLPPETVLSITSHISLGVKTNLFPILTFLAGRTITSHKFSASSRNKKTSTLASVLSLVANNLAGNTLVLFKISKSFFLRWSTMFLNFLCSIVFSFLLTTINLESSLFFPGYCAICFFGNG